MCKELDYIRTVIVNHDLSLTWLAKQIGKGWTKQRLHYILNNGKDISVTAYDAIRTVLDKYNFTLSDFDEERTLLVHTAMLNEQSAHLVNQTLDAFTDHQLKKKEKADIRLTITEIKSRLEKLEKQLKNGEEK